MITSLYLRCSPGDIKERVLLTGDPARVDLILEHLTDARIIARHREFVVGGGLYNGMPFTAVASGIGAPSAAIALEELSQLGMKAVTRVGTTMALNAPLGSFVLSLGAARFEGTSNAYLPIAFPSIPDWRLSQALMASIPQGIGLTTGITASFDAFYTAMAPALVGEKMQDLDLMRRANVQAMDMETSVVYTLGTRLRFAAASLCVVTNRAYPFEVIANEPRVEREKQLIETVLRGMSAWTLP
jgi:uridine phosphorylase